jgi:hypothetical protein
MRGASLAVAALIVAAAAAGCGGSPRTGQRSLNSFLASAAADPWAKRFPHQPGSIACMALDPTVKRRVPATCSTDLSLDQDRVIVTFTESWSHGNRARTWFVFLRRNGTVERVQREGAGA